MVKPAWSESSRPPENTSPHQNGSNGHTSMSVRDACLILLSGLVGVGIAVFWKPLLGLSAIILIEGWPLAVLILMVYGMYRLIKYLTREDAP
jgi:hypothetical protein